MLLAEILSKKDVLIKGGVVYSSLFDGTNIEMHSKVKIRDGVIVSSKSKFNWAKGTIQDYIKKYTISSVLPKIVDPIEHNLERASKLPNMRELLQNILLDLELSIINPNIYFMADIGKWYIFGSFGAIRGAYTGSSDMVVPIDFLMKFCGTSAWLLDSDNYYGITYSDLTFKYIVYREKVPGDVVLSPQESKTIHLIDSVKDPIKIDGKMVLGDLKMNVYQCPYGLIYSNKYATMYKFSTVIECVD